MVKLPAGSVRAKYTTSSSGTAINSTIQIIYGTAGRVRMACCREAVCFSKDFTA